MNTLGSGQISSRAAAFPCVLRFTDIRLYILVTAFVALGTGVPWALHKIHPLAGAAFLPLFFFTLLAGLLFGWRVGLLVGFVGPLVSYGISGMPPLWRLPEMVIEGSMFGLSAGLGLAAVEQIKTNVDWRGYQRQFHIDKTSLDRASALLFHSDALARLVMNSALTPAIYKIVGILRSAREKEIADQLGKRKVLGPY